MAENLEEIIRALAARGELSHISLMPSRNGWRASFAMCSKFGVSFGEHRDPVEAVRIACTTAKMKPQRQPAHREPSIEEVGKAAAEYLAPAADDVADLM